LPGDIVEWKEDKCHLVKRGFHRFIPGVLELKSKYMYGHTSRGAKIYLFHPHDRKYPPFRVGSTSRNTDTNQVGLIELMDWDEFETTPRGNLLRILGPCGTLHSEKEALLYQFSYPKKAAELFDIHDDTETKRKRLEGYTFNIDPDGCMDIDDILTLNPISPTKWQFVITIADVAAHILEGSAGDKHAYTLGQTLYQNGEAAVPMLPSALSEMALSLRPKETHLGVSLFCVWDTESKSLTVEDFQETTFQSNAKYTYETIYKAQEVPIHLLEDIASYLKGSPTSDSHEWIAEYMILYNKQVAQVLLKHKRGLLRTHKPANAERLEQFQAIHPDLKVLAYESAKYEPTGENQIHATLGSVPYCHATSPLRRYADLVNQRALKAILHEKPVSPVPKEFADHLNIIQKKQRQYERCLFFLETIAENPTGTVKGLVVSSTEEKTKLYVPSWKQIIKVTTQGFSVGQTVRVDYYADFQKPHWDERMVFRVTKHGAEDAERGESNN
jgi:exoribonuclease R